MRPDDPGTPLGDARQHLVEETAALEAELRDDRSLAYDKGWLARNEANERRSVEHLLRVYAAADEERQGRPRAIHFADGRPNVDFGGSTR